METQVRQAVPAIDEVVSDYAADYVAYIKQQAENPESAQDLDVASELAFVQEVLLSAGGDSLALDDLQNKLQKELEKLREDNLHRTVANLARLKLDKDTLLSAQKRNAVSMDAMEVPIDIDLVSGNRKVGSRVDKKKLAKQEKKIQQKLAKREAGFMKDLTYETSKLLEEKDNNNFDEFFLTVNPLELGPSEGRTKDIKIDNFDLSVGSGIRILQDSTLTLSYGHRYGLVGANGIGKSTLLKALSRRELPVPKHITILYVEQEVTGDDNTVLQTVLDADVWRKYLLKDQTRISERTAQINSEQESLDDEDPLSKQLDEELGELQQQLNDIYEKLQEIDSDTAESRAATILNGLGFSQESQHRPTNTFSGGWRMRLSLARALFCKPDLLMLDEPSNMLDVPSITFLANYLQSYTSTVLVVSHDRAFLNDVATDIVHQHSERLDYYRGCDFDTFYATKEERYKNAKREYDNQMAYRQHLQAFIDKFRYNAAKSSEAQSRIKKLERLPVLEEPMQEGGVSFSFPEPEKLSPPILQLNGATFSYSDNGPRVLDDVDLTVDMESRIALVGGNGCGKTTLLKLLLGTLQPQVGHVSRHPRLRIGYFAQHHVDGMDLSLSAIEWMAKVKPGKSDEEYRRLLGAFGISGPLGLQKLALLSGGQKSRVAFACLGLSQPHILILDEPSNHLDIAGLDALADALKNFKGGILMVSHDVTTIKRVANEIYVSENGKVVRSQGTIDDYKRRILKQAGVTGVVQRH